MISLLVSYLLIQTITAQESNYQCDPTPLGLSDNCIGCICEASTRCDQATQCVGGNSFCGPFLISKSFWTDAGQCVIEGDNSQDPESWRRCSLDIICAANTIRSYINRFGKDCNGDQLVTCEDYVMIHKNGGWNCGNSLAGTDFWNIFQKCKADVLSGGQNI
ncbi:invertebrate-type lysozyme 6 isoform X1 [Eurytemora carolleeae]|uniref:invertebrate-type lysozyme 6 isoform X1 n=1 Tax=Eurytemora carolleeae TaxID=1294199 RepID=UPI000C75AE2B|nr:invertebrate-type lysozyme 6 isoform X1 [Eurytemora carolleeae]|eukprot:XP_023326767.1 invertebrate-type lysozyme 6-like isoform X1 [Eurytemora affinis]